MDNNKLLEEIKNIVRAEIQTEVAPINKRLDSLEQGQKNLEQTMATKEDIKVLEKGQIQTNTSISRITTALEALKEGQDSSTAAIRADIQDLGSKMAKNKRETDIRLDALEDHTRLSNPIKH